MPTAIANRPNTVSAVASNTIPRITKNAANTSRRIRIERSRSIGAAYAWGSTPDEDADASRLLAFRGHTLDLDALELHAGDRKYQLTQMECDLLAYLIRNAGKAVSRKAILEHVWAVHEDTDTRAIDG